MAALLFLLAGIIGFGIGWAIFSAKLARLQAEKEALTQRLAEQPEQVKLMASAVLEDLSARFSTQSEKKIGDLLHPVQQHLNDFKKLVVDSFTAHGKEQHTLKSEIEKIVLQADSLTKALRGDVKAQGNWGEVMLEKILEESGLRKGTDYIIQATDLGLAGADGNRLRPDVIVNMPDNKHIIVDSKVSLIAYERFSAAADDTTRAACLQDFLRSVKTHVNGLEQKRYQDIEKLGTPDFVVMFMPIEGAYSLAVQQDPELHSYAWNKHIVLANPANLFAILRTVQNLWRIEMQNRHAQEIARQGGALYDKFAGFVEDMQSIGAQLSRTQKTYDDALGKLSEGKGNLISRAENLKSLGIKASKSLPKELTGKDEEVVLPLAVEG